MDVGCGEGLLVERMAQVSDDVLGIDRDDLALSRARQRLADRGLVNRRGARVISGDVMTSPELGGQEFDLVTCVAVLHHLPLQAALLRLRELVAPGGELRIIGLSANKTVADWVVASALVPPVFVMSRVRGESRVNGMVTARPSHSLGEVRRAAAAALPGSRVRRRFYYRYSLTWGKPA